MEPNHVTAMIGAVMLIVAGVGLAVVEEPQRGPETTSHKWHLSFPTAEEKETSAGSAPDGSEAEALVTVDMNNITIVGIIVRWTDSPPNRFSPAAIVSVQVKDPAGTQVGTGQGQDGSAGLAIPCGMYNEVPPEINITAGSESKAWQKVFDDYPPTTNGTGGWKVVVSVTRGGFSPLRSGSVDFTIDLVYSFYEANLEEVSK